MKPNRLIQQLPPALLSVALFCTVNHASGQTSGTWTDVGFGPSDWSNTARWASGTVANGATATAAFSSNITQFTVVTVNANRTIGNVTFSDNGANGSPWLLRGTNTLTLDNGANPAVITKTTGATISAPLAGSNIRISGGSGIAITGNNTGITGTLALNGINGVTISNANAFGTAAISFTNNEALSGTTRGIAISNNITIGSGLSYFTGTFGLTLNGSLTLAGGTTGFNTFTAVTDTVQAGPVSLGTNTLTVGGSTTGGLRISGAISGTGGISKSGSHPLTLSGNNSYSGTTTATAGRLVLNTSGHLSPLNLTTTAVLAGEGTTSAGITMGAGTTLAFDPSTAGALTSAGAVDFAGATSLAFEPTQPLAEGTITVDVLKYGTLANFANLGTPSGLRSASLLDDTANSKITLTLNTGSRIWTPGEFSSDWDILTSTNWSGGDNLFANGDSVTFDDTASNGQVTLVGQPRPAAITFDNSTVDFTITPVTAGTDQITGATSITKLGAASATLAGTNSFTGGVTITDGVLGFANGGLGSLGNIVMNGGTLRWHGSNTQNLSPRLVLVDGKTATLDVGSNDVTFNASLGGSTATTAAIVKTGSGTLTLANAHSPGTYSGGTTINGGTLSLGTGGTGNLTCSPAALGSGIVTINPGATLRLWIQNSQAYTITNSLTIDGGTLRNEDGNHTMTGTVDVGTNGATFQAVWSGKNLSINNTISGSGPVTIQGNAGAGTGGQIRFFGNNTYTGATTLSNGSLLLSGASASSGFSIASGTTLVLRTISLGATQNITGAGAVTKDISTFGASTISGNNNTYTGATTVNIDRFTLGSTGVINGTSSITVQGQWSARFENLGSTTTPGAVNANGFAGSGTASEAGIFYNGNLAGTTPGSLTAASITLGSSFRNDAGSPAKGGEFLNYTNSTINLGSGAITVNGQGNALAGGMVSAGSQFTNAGTVTAGSVTLNSSSTANVATNKGGTYTQSAGSTTVTTITLAANGGTGAAGTAGNDAALNLTGGTINTTTLAVDSGTVTATGGTLNIGSGGITSAGGRPIAINLGATTLGANSAWSTTLPVTLTNVATGTTVNTGGGNISLSGTLSGTGKLNKSGTGTLLLAGTHSFSGGTVVAAGTLAGDTTLSSSLAVQSGGVISPGSGGPGTMATGSLTLDGSYACDVTGGSSDTINVTGDVTIALGSIQIAASSPSAASYTLLTYTGTLSGDPTATGVVTGVPSGYTIENDLAGKAIRIVQSVSSAYDTWSAGYGLTGGDALRASDPDADGFSNLQEYLFGTTPNAPTGALVQTTTAGGNLTLRWLQRESGAGYAVKQSPSLATGSWTTVGGAAISGDQSGAPMDYDFWSLTVPAGPGKNFYRVESVETP